MHDALSDMIARGDYESGRLRRVEPLPPFPPLAMYSSETISSGSKIATELSSAATTTMRFVGDATAVGKEQLKRAERTLV